ncbi:MAG: helix-turn-helix domain-containing protein [Chloroflexi bacterium]|nr:helix-turn-helix domain-containing protein [Chloroflexota bacterium]
MVGRKFIVEWDDKDTPEALKAAYLAEESPSVKTRLQGLSMLRRGMTLAEVARSLDVNYRTVQRWISWYRNGGLAEVLAHRKRGRKPYLDSDEVTLLGWEVESGCFGMAKDVRDYIETQCGVTYTMPGVYSLMRRVN